MLIFHGLDALYKGVNIVITREHVESLMDIGILPRPVRNKIASGTVTNCSDHNKNWVIESGVNFLNAATCKEMWTAFTLNLIDKVRILTGPERETAINQIDAEHIHWDWVNKSKHYQQDEYSWFYFLVDDSIEAVCLTYHPKDSVIDSEKIFYIEYIAVAPWNKAHPLFPRKFSGIGSLMISNLQRYFKDSLGYRYGFSLHSLPQAESYYQHIGMTPIKGHEKDNLPYLEMDSQSSERFCGDCL